MLFMKMPYPRMILSSLDRFMHYVEKRTPDYQNLLVFA